MLEWILRNIITCEFEERVGRGQDPMFSKKTDSNFYAMDIDFKLGRFKGEEGYRHLRMRIYGSMNYVAVLVKEDWDIIPEDDIDWEKDCLKPGKEYTKGSSGWMLASYHDSCWTTDGVDSVINAYSNRLNSIDTIGCNSGWYGVVNLTEADRKEINDLISARDNRDFSKHWDRDKIQRPLFGKETV